MGTIPLILAFVGVLARPASRATMPWRLIVPVSFALATMPRWWPQGYLYLLACRGSAISASRRGTPCSPRLGLAILAGEGFDRSISNGPIPPGTGRGDRSSAGAPRSAAAFWSMRPDVHLRSDVRRDRRRLPLGGPGLVDRPGGRAGLAIGPARVVGSAGRRRDRAGNPLLRGDDPVGLVDRDPRAEPGPDELAREPSVGLIGGELENLPVRAGLATAFPYLGFAHPYPNKVLVLVAGAAVPIAGRRRRPTRRKRPTLKRWLRRCRVTHLVDYRRTAAALGEELGRWRDPALDRIVYHAAGEPATRSWSIVRAGRAVPRGARGRPCADDRRPRRAHRSTLAVGRPRHRLVPGRGPGPRSSRRAVRPAGLVGRHRPRRSSTTAPATWCIARTLRPRLARPDRRAAPSGRSCPSTADSRPSASRARASIA